MHERLLIDLKPRGDVLLGNISASEYHKAFYIQDSTKQSLSDAKKWALTTFSTAGTSLR